MANLVVALFEVQGGLCFICDKPMMPRGHGLYSWTRDHVFPRSTTGAGLHNNIVLAHALCNHERGCPEPSAEQIEKARSIYATMGLVAFVQDQVDGSTIAAIRDIKRIRAKIAQRPVESTFYWERGRIKVCRARIAEDI